MVKVLGLKQIKQKKYKKLDGLSDEIRRSFGDLVEGFIMIVWGQSASGKSNLLMQFLKFLVPYGKALYISLEEGFESTISEKAHKYFPDEYSGKIEYADHNMTYDELVKKLQRKRSPKIVVVDSLQYWDINYTQYKKLKETFPSKIFIFISHAKGKRPDGKTADKIRYDAGVKVQVEGLIAFPASRYGGNKPYVIHEEGAKKYWGKKFKTIIK